MIVFIGDSYVAAEAPGMIALRETVAEPIRARGIVGASTRTWLAQDLAATVAGASLVVVHLGINDSRPSAATMSELDQALRTVAPNRVVWVGPPNAPTVDRDRISRALWSARLSALVVLPPFPPEAYRPDGLHLSRAGGVLWAEALLSQLERFGVHRRSPTGQGLGRILPVLAVGVLAYLGWKAFA